MAEKSEASHVVTEPEPTPATTASEPAATAPPATQKTATPAVDDDSDPDFDDLDGDSANPLQFTATDCFQMSWTNSQPMRLLTHPQLSRQRQRRYRRQQLRVQADRVKQ